MNKISDAELVAALDDACRDAGDREFQSAAEMGSRLRAVIVDADDPRQALQCGLEYHLRLRGEAGEDAAPFGPMMELAGTIYPMPLEMIPGDVLELWARAAQLAKQAIPRARFADLLWERGYGDRPHEWAALAIDAYLVVPTDDYGGRMAQLDSLYRALDLSAKLNDQSRRARAIAALLDLAEHELERDEPAPGVVINAIDLVARRPPDQRPAELAALLERAIDLYDDIWLFESLLDIKATLALPEERVALREVQVARFADAGRSAAGLQGFSLLGHAFELAETHGLGEIARQLRVEIQNIPPESLELHEVTGEINVPTEAIDRFVDAVVGDDDLLAALDRLGRSLPTGQVESNRQHVEALAREFPLTRRLLLPTILGPEGSVIAEVTPESREDFQLTEHEALAIRVFALAAVEMFSRLRGRYAPEGLTVELRERLVDFFNTELMTAPIAEKIVHALDLYFSDDFDASACVLVPRLERVVRNTARAIGLPITQSPNPRTGAPGGVRTLGDIIRSLEGHLDESWRRYLRCLLTAATGVNLRNRVSHGLVDAAGAPDAAALLHAACYLRLLGATPAAGEPGA